MPPARASLCSVPAAEKKTHNKQTNKKKQPRSQHRKPCLMLLVSRFSLSLGHSVVCGSCKFRKMKVSERAAVQAASLIWIGILNVTYSQADRGSSGSARNRRRPLPSEALGRTIALEVKQLLLLPERPCQVPTQEGKAEKGWWGAESGLWEVAALRLQ